MESYVFVLFVVYTYVRIADGKFMYYIYIYIDYIEFSIGLDFFDFPCPTICI